ncbi:T9SS type A sorting domain-containing protein [Flavobacterium antarcticum]|uniref:T9SS type A sorting domain-containing protein n=1 Tax=Flavobacterium antarcticum TaxID=271155 RepID=UPI0003B411CC|nr:T9SS type A sorting domain-containing protein [Flavobacterium antarcticum]
MKKILLLSICLTALTSFGQDFWTSKATTFSELSRGLDDISIVDNNVIWAKAYDGASNTPANVRQFTRSIDGGNTWNSGYINLGTNQSFLSISSIHAFSATTAWVTAYSTNPNTVLGGIWKTTDSGATWAKQSTALFNDTSDSFTNIVYFWDATNGFAQGDPAGGYFELYTTTNGGTNWTRVPSANIPAPLTNEYGYVHNYDVSGNIIWFGTNKGRIFKSIDKGLNWTVSQSPITDFGGSTTSGSYAFKDAMNGLLVKSGTTPLLYKTINGGTTWTSVAFTGVMGGNDLAYIPGTNTAITVGSANNIYYTSYSNDNGLTWTQLTPGVQIGTLKFKDSFLGFGSGFTTSPTAGGIYKYTGTQLGINSFNAESKLAVWPNPAQNTVQFSGVDVTSVVIFDVLGKQVLSQNFTSGKTAVDVSNLKTGMYVVQASDANGAVSTVKFMKK